MKSFVLWCLITLVTAHQGSPDYMNFSFRPFVEILQTNLCSVLLYVWSRRQHLNTYDVFGHCCA